MTEPHGKTVWSVRDSELRGLHPVSSSERMAPHQHLDLFIEPGLPVLAVPPSRERCKRNAVERALQGTTATKQVGMAVGRRERTPLDPFHEQGAAPPSQHPWEIALVQQSGENFDTPCVSTRLEAPPFENASVRQLQAECSPLAMARWQGAHAGHTHERSIECPQERPEVLPELIFRPPRINGHSGNRRKRLPEPGERRNDRVPDLADVVEHAVQDVSSSPIFAKTRGQELHVVVGLLAQVSDDSCAEMARTGSGDEAHSRGKGHTRVPPADRESETASGIRS